MNEQEIIDTMEALSELEAQRAVMASEYDTQIASLTAFRDGVCEEIDGQIEGVRLEIKAAVVELGKSVKAAHLHAVYSKPRVNWNSKALDGYALSHPELFAFRREGKPSCSIRARR
jgi:hypothetical protein